jgi:hypothetical protein
LAAVVVVYKGVGVGTYLHGQNLQSTGITAARPGQSNNLANLVRHVAQGSALSPFISFTKSWDVAEDYARNGGKFRPTSGNPAEVWEVHIPHSLPRGVEVIDPVFAVAAQHRNPLTSNYHHDGNQAFLLFVVDPTKGLPPNTRSPPGLTGGTPRPPTMTLELQTMVRALRDAEVIVYGTVPQAWLASKHVIS